jgi:hypothetical protein
MQNDRKHVFRVALVNLDISVSTSGRFYTHFLVVWGGRGGTGANGADGGGGQGGRTGTSNFSPTLPLLC